MKKEFIYIIALLAYLFITGNSIAQPADSSKLHLSVNYSNGLNGYLQNNHSGNIFYNSYYTYASIGIRKELYHKENFIGFYFTYTDRSTRSNTYFGNSFLPDLKRYHNHYLSFHAEGGFYFNKNWHFIEHLGFDYLVKSTQYANDDFGNFRGIKRFTICFESGIGNDFKLSPTLYGFVEIFAGMTFFNPLFVYAGPKIGIFFKEADIEVGHRSSF